MEDLTMVEVSNLSSRDGKGVLRIDDFARLFGTAQGHIPRDCTKMIQEGNFRYRELEKGEIEIAVLTILKKLESGGLTIAGDGGAKARWEKGWAENLAKLSKGSSVLSALAPAYIRNNQVVRLGQRFVQPNDPRFEYSWYLVFVRWLFQEFLSKADTIYEFGCGSGINIAILAQMFPEKRIVGLDWASSSKKIVDNLARTRGLRVSGRLFDFFNPDRGLKLAENDAVLTVGALEQTGPRFTEFLNYLTESKSMICVNIEPICEWYDENNLADYLAILFHRRRGYWLGFPSKLDELQKEGRIEIIKQKRSYFGSLYIEGYSQNIWRPAR